MCPALPSKSRGFCYGSVSTLHVFQTLCPPKHSSQGLGVLGEGYPDPGRVGWACVCPERKERTSNPP